MDDGWTLVTSDSVFSFVSLQANCSHSCDQLMPDCSSRLTAAKGPTEYGQVEYEVRMQGSPVVRTLLLEAVIGVGYTTIVQREVVDQREISSQSFIQTAFTALSAYGPVSQISLGSAEYDLSDQVTKEVIVDRKLKFFGQFTFRLLTNHSHMFLKFPRVEMLDNIRGSLVFELVPYQNGNATFEFSMILPNGNFSGTSFNIDVLPVNQPPRFHIESLLLVEEASKFAPVIVQGFATDIAPGPAAAADERNQELNFILQAASPGDFLTLPHLDVMGNLSFRLVESFCGKTCVDVILRDNGGTANGGQDESSASFCLQIAYNNTAPEFALLQSSITINEGEVLASELVTNISSGSSPCGDVNQELTFKVSYLPGTSPADSPLPDLFVNGSVFFRPQPSQFGTFRFGVQLADNGGVTNYPMTSNVRELDINISPCNNPPDFDIASTSNETVRMSERDRRHFVSILEMQTVESLVFQDFVYHVQAGPANEACQQLQMQVQGDVTSAFLYAYVSLDINSTYFDHCSAASDGVVKEFNGSFSFALVPHWNGVVNFSLVLTDGGLNGGCSRNSFERKLSLHVIPVNSAPLITAVPIISLSEGQNLTTVDHFANISSGAYDEVQQVLSVSLEQTSGPVGVIAQLRLFCVSEGEEIEFPTACASGVVKLIIKPERNRFGLLNFTIRVSDSGGTESGGVNSTSTSFLVSVVARNNPPAFRPTMDAIKVAQDAGFVLLPAFIQHISLGPWESLIGSDCPSALDCGRVLRCGEPMYYCEDQNGFFDVEVRSLCHERNP
eukprot:756013-Hanusia_phi.AAC.12